MVGGKNIILGVCGSIAAFKAVYLLRLLKKNGANVRVILTEPAKNFVGEATFSTLSENPVGIDFYKRSGEWENHIEWGLWADLMIVAPASANSIAKMSHGFCDNLLTAVYLSARCPVIIAPAMDEDMYLHPSTQHNIEELERRGHHLLRAGHGELASGLIGHGRLMDPDLLFECIDNFFERKNDLEGAEIMVTAGPTFEAIDPVRFIGNHSSGKMGIAISEAAYEQGANVTLILGPGSIEPKNTHIKIYRVESAEEMYQVAKDIYHEVDIAIFAAAVSDYRPEHSFKEKVKKEDKKLTINFIKNPDIAYELGQLKNKNQINVGFALETENEQYNAKEKLKKKNFDLIILNTLKDQGAGFMGDTNKIAIIDQQNNVKEFKLKSKRAVAEDILDAIKEKQNGKS